MFELHGLDLVYAVVFGMWPSPFFCQGSSSTLFMCLCLSSFRARRCTRVYRSAMPTGHVGETSKVYTISKTRFSLKCYGEGTGKGRGTKRLKHRIWYWPKTKPRLIPHLAAGVGTKPESFLFSLRFSRSEEFGDPAFPSNGRKAAGHRGGCPGRRRGPLSGRGTRR